METLIKRAQVEWVSSGCDRWPISTPAPTKEFDDEGFRNAYLYMVHMALREVFSITEEDLRILHTKLYCGDKIYHPGQYRIDEVSLSGSDYQFPVACRVPFLIKKLCKRWNQIQVNDPVLFAAQVHQELVDIHPFYNGNGRVARLCMNAVLLRYNYWPIFITEQWRVEYSATLHQSQVKGNKDKFVALIRKIVEENEKSHREEGKEK